MNIELPNTIFRQLHGQIPLWYKGFIERKCVTNFRKITFLIDSLVSKCKSRDLYSPPKPGGTTPKTNPKILMCSRGV